MAEFFVEYYKLASKLLGGLLSDFKVFFGPVAKEEEMLFRRCGERLLRVPITMGWKEINAAVDRMFVYAKQPGKGLNRDEFKMWAHAEEPLMYQLSSVSEHLRAMGTGAKDDFGGHSKSPHRASPKQKTPSHQNVFEGNT